MPHCRCSRPQIRRVPNCFPLRDDSCPLGTLRSPLRWPGRFDPSEPHSNSYRIQIHPISPPDCSNTQWSTWCLPPLLLIVNVSCKWSPSCAPRRGGYPGPAFHHKQNVGCPSDIKVDCWVGLNLSFCAISARDSFTGVAVGLPSGFVIWFTILHESLHAIASSFTEPIYHSSDRFHSGLNTGTLIGGVHELFPFW